VSERSEHDDEGRQPDEQATADATPPAPTSAAPIDPAPADPAPADPAPAWQPADHGAAYGTEPTTGFGTEPTTELTRPTAGEHLGWPQPAYAPHPYSPGYPAPATTSRLPGWTWPLVSVLALLLGLTGGAIAGALVAGDGNGSGAGGVLKVERRTAAPLDADNTSIAAVSAKVLPSTVQIVAEYGGKAQGATGSGFVFDKQGHVITNNHVVAEAAGDNGPIEVIDHEGRHMTATVVGRSTVYDIAVLDVKGAADLPPAAIGSSTQMHVGETVVAFGSPLGLSATVTSGIISAVDRPVTTSGDGGDSSYINAVQTDAAINPGNSGGPLVNLQGQVIGVNSAIASLGSSVSSDAGGNIGVGFAIPIEQVQVTTDQILRTGKAQYPVIGANVQGTAKLDGARVDSIASGSPASKSDLEVGDVIVKVDGKPVTGSIDVVVAVRAHQPGEKVTLTVRRDGKEMQIVVGLQAKTG
jgi:putative serine protease PepD